jgi:hypothetical protein
MMSLGRDEVRSSKREKRAQNSHDEIVMQTSPKAQNRCVVADKKLRGPHNTAKLLNLRRLRIHALALCLQSHNLKPS